MLGIPGVRAAQRLIDSREFAEYMAYDHIGPIGADRLDELTKIAASAASNANPFRRHAAQPSDFSPWWEERPETEGPSAEEVFESFASSWNAEGKGKNG